MTTRNITIAAGIGLALALYSVGTLNAGEAGTQMEAVHRFLDKSVLDGGQASLMRMDNGVSMTVDTIELTPGDAVTAWFVIFNTPAQCSGGECGEDDIFNQNSDGSIAVNPDGSPPMNMSGIDAASISVFRADGLIVDTSGAASFRGHLPVGDTTEALFGPGLLDPYAAEIHAVIRTHRQAIPGQTDAMINTLNGGCSPDWPNEPCEDVQFAVFKPAL
jgi:hypothetical protein